MSTDNYHAQEHYEEPAPAAPHGGGGMNAAGNSTELVDLIVRPDVPGWMEEDLGVPELADDFVLSKFDDAEHWEMKWRMKNRFAAMRRDELPAHTPTNPVLAEVMTGEGKQVIDSEKSRHIDTAEMLAEARLSRAKGGWQQNVLTKVTNEVRRVSGGVKNKAKGFFSRILGGN